MSSNHSTLFAGVDLSTIKKITIHQACYESKPCKHDVTLVGKDDSIITKGPIGSFDKLVEIAKELNITLENESHLDLMSNDH